MVRVVSVRFKRVGKAYYFDPRDIPIKKNDALIVETASGEELGICVQPPMLVDDEKIVAPLKNVVRVATVEDRSKASQNSEKEEKAMLIAARKIAERGMEMKLVDVEYTFDGSKIIFFFTADGRVDFRELVKDLAGAFHMRIELRQIGVRDEAKMLGGLGICGKPFCCATFLEEFQPVSIKMAKDQNLSLNPVKISGTCGRLMCCLKFEQEAYEDFARTTPRYDTVVRTPEGVGSVVDSSMLRDSVSVRLESAPDTVKCFKRCDVCPLKHSVKPTKAVEEATARKDDGARRPEDTVPVAQADGSDVAPLVTARKMPQGAAGKPRQGAAAKQSLGAVAAGKPLDSAETAPQSPQQNDVMPL